MITNMEYFCNQFGISKYGICWSNLFTCIKEFFSLEYWLPVYDPFIKEYFKKGLQQKTLSELKDLLCETNVEIKKVNIYKRIVDNALEDIYDIIYKNRYLYEQTAKLLKDLIHSELYPSLYSYGRVLNQKYQILQYIINKKISSARNLKNIYKNDLSKYSTDDLLNELKRRIEKR